MNTDKDFEYIDSYLEGALSAEEELKFKNRVSEDEEFNKTYQFILSVREASTIANEVRRIKDMLKAEHLDDFGHDFTPEGKVISLNQASGEAALGQNKEIEQTKTFSIWPYLKYAGIAATIAIIFLVWQPTKESNDEIFASYTSGNLEVPQLAMLDSKNYSKENSFEGDVNSGMGSIQGSLRGGESKPEQYTHDEWQEVLRAIEMVQAREYSKAKKIFSSTLKSNENNSQLLLYYAISQLNSNEVEKSIFALEQLKESTNSYRDAINFHLAMGYIKVGKRSEARALLKTVKGSGCEFSSQASAVLNDMRWF